MKNSDVVFRMSAKASYSGIFLEFFKTSWNRILLGKAIEFNYSFASAQKTVVHLSQLDKGADVSDPLALYLNVIKIQ